MNQESLSSCTGTSRLLNKLLANKILTGVVLHFVEDFGVVKAGFAVIDCYFVFACAKFFKGKTHRVAQLLTLLIVVDQVNQVAALFSSLLLLCFGLFRVSTEQLGFNLLLQGQTFLADIFLE
jgi:hypothetical protein